MKQKAEKKKTTAAVEAPVAPPEPAKDVCAYCRKEVRPGDKRYLSRQAGMKGLYHWDCFLQACRHANKVGAQEIETIAVSAGLYDNFGGFDSAEE